VFESRVLRRIFGPQRDEVIGGWRNFHRQNKGFHNLYSSSNFIMMIKSRSVGLVGHVARMGGKRMRSMRENLKKRAPWKN
jgi:hypothetical protein